MYVCIFLSDIQMEISAIQSPQNLFYKQLHAFFASSILPAEFTRGVIAKTNSYGNFQLARQ